VRGELTAAQAIDEVRVQGREVDDFYNVFVVDGGRKLLGTVRLDDLILADPAVRVSELVQSVPASVLPDTDQEDVGRLFARYNVVSLPVVDLNGTLLGRITFDDVIDVIESEQTEDILRLAGLVVLLAMWGNLIVAGFAGAFVPATLDRLGVDPSVASSVFVHTLTDLCGFFLLLGLASKLLLDV
jgi:magnesium transporter